MLALYLDTSAILRATLEVDASPDVERRIEQAEVLLTSRLSIVESARALIRLRQRLGVTETQLADLGRQIEEILSRCDLWELTADVCDLASRVAPDKNLRTLDALHLATYSIARRRIENLELLTSDQRLAQAAGAT